MQAGIAVQGTAAHRLRSALAGATYDDNGAAALSVLTDEQFFQGALATLVEARFGFFAAGAAQGLGHQRISSV